MLTNLAPLFAATVVAGLAAAAPPKVARFTVDGRPVVVVTPGRGTGPWPVLYVMGGMGELSRGEAVSAAAWVDDYAIPRVVEALESGRLSEDTFRGLVDARLLRQYRRRLKEGYGGLVLVGLPAPVDLTDDFRRYLVDKVIPWAERTLPIQPGPNARGIDGVSLGGRHALRIGLARPYAFRTIGAVQGAVRGRQAELVELAHAVVSGARRPTLSLITSDGDPYRGANRSLVKALRAEGLPVRYGVLVGPHDYVFNRGPAAVDLLLFHDAVLNRTCPPAPFPVQ